MEGTTARRLCSTAAIWLLVVIPLSSVPQAQTISSGEAVNNSSQAPLGGTLVLDGIDDYAETADHWELDLAGGSFTVEAWVNFQDLSWEGVFIKAGAYALHIEKTYSYPTWHHCMGIDYPCGVIHCTSSKYLSLGWRHGALVYDASAGQARAYYDGTQRWLGDLFGQRFGPAAESREGPHRQPTGRCG